VLCVGVVYGRSGCDLRAEVEGAVGGGESEVLGLKNDRLVKGDGVVPVVHVDRVLEEVEGLVYGGGDKEIKEGDSMDRGTRPYQVLCEDQSRLVVDMIATMNEVCGNMRQLNQSNQLNQVTQNTTTNPKTHQ